jgi:deazaflavin-dependent oxidoreductase (nitroreductase family)
MPSDVFFKFLNAAHGGVLRISGGRLGWRTGNMPVVRLTTTGRKTGLRHTVMLTSPVQEDSTLVLVASRGGDDRHPAWFLNLRDEPNVEVTLGGEPPRPMHARVASVEEKARLWPQVTAAYRGYEKYQRKTDRDIPLVLLEPADAM